MIQFIKWKFVFLQLHIHNSTELLINKCTEEKSSFFSPKIISRRMTRILVVWVLYQFSDVRINFQKVLNICRARVKYCCEKLRYTLHPVFFYFHDIAANVRRVCIFIRECKFFVYVLPTRRVTIEVRKARILKKPNWNSQWVISRRNQLEGREKFIFFFHCTTFRTRI